MVQQMPAPAAEVPSALERFDTFAAAVSGYRPAVFLDYDGTLTPIVAHPALATLAESTRAALRRLAALCPVAVVSGRDLDDVAAMVGLEELIYAGSHGFDIRGPGLRTQIGLEYLNDLQQAEIELTARLPQVSGLLIERKRFAIAIHTRQLDPAIKPELAHTVRSLAGDYVRLRLTGGKEIIELRPALAWDKGRAVLALLDSLGLTGTGIAPVYIGDDETDEDAFRALAGEGAAPAAGRSFAIRVAETGGPTAAGWSLRNPAEVCRFLACLTDWLTDRPPHPQTVS